MKNRSGSKNYKHLEGLTTKAVFSDCGKYRYLLEIKKDTKETGRHVCVVMLNPSVADENRADKSVQFLEKLIFETRSPHFNRVGRLTIVNLFAFIQTHQFEGNTRKIGPLNDQYLHRAISEADLVLIGWGKTCKHPERQEVVKKFLEEFPKKPVFITKTHPSRGTYRDFVLPFSTKKKGP